MNEHCSEHPVIARYSRRLTRLTYHLITSTHIINTETEDFIVQKEAANTLFLIQKMNEYIDAICAHCDKLNIPDVYDIIIDAICDAR